MQAQTHEFMECGGDTCTHADCSTHHVRIALSDCGAASYSKRFAVNGVASDSLAAKWATAQWGERDIEQIEIRAFNTDRRTGRRVYYRNDWMERSGHVICAVFTALAALSASITVEHQQLRDTVRAYFTARDRQIPSWSHLQLKGIVRQRTIASRERELNIATRQLRSMIQENAMTNTTTDTNECAHCHTGLDPHDCDEWEWCDSTEAEFLGVNEGDQVCESCLDDVWGTHNA